MKLCCHGNWNGSEEQNKNVNWFTLKECDGGEISRGLCLMDKLQAYTNKEIFMNIKW